MGEKTIEPNADGVLLVKCECGATIARHVHQTPPRSGEFFEVLCVCCKKRRHVFMTRDGKVFYNSSPSEPINMGGGFEG
ncbi:hypothetical protein LCGC14_0259200 [marine sediment metagenome]|uniref:Uncharacterized protein n=1 Tax=marine sediment metagenome TaxID=412755 RepID=A0A0F9U2J1_9ZZZZ